MNRPTESQVVSGALPYLLSAPPTPPPGSSLPLLCFLHGYDEGPPTPLRDGLTRHGPLAPHAHAVARSAFIVVAPQLPGRGDRWHSVGDEVMEITERVQDAYGGDPGRRYLTGFSYGANGVFDLAGAQPDGWAALWSVDPTRIPARDPRCPVWLSSGEVSRRQESAYIERLGLAPLIGAPTGDRVITDCGEDHVGTAADAYGDERIYRWLLRWHL